MWRALLELLDASTRAVFRRVTAPALSIFLAAILVLVALLALSAATYLSLAPIVGPIGSALAVAAGALVLAVIALLPLLMRRHPPAPPPSANPVDVATILPLLLDVVKTRPLLIGALVIALVATLTSKPPKNNP